MRARLSLVTLALLAQCSAPAREPSGLSPDLLRAWDEAGEGRRRVLAVPRRDGARWTGAAAKRFRHVGVVVAELDRSEAEALAATGDWWLTPDRPLVASGRGRTAEADVVRRAIGADQVAGDGSGVVIAIVDSGVRANQPDFPSGAIVAARDFVDGDDAAASSDPYGHGTMVAGVLLGERSGVRGVAPGAGIVSARVLDDEGAGSTSDAIEAIDWIVENADTTGVRIVHLSVGAAPYESFTTDPLAQAVEAALDAGLVVVAAAGNFGSSDDATVYGGIVSPGTHPGVITVGAADGAGTAARSDDAVAAWSSRGPTLWDGLGKPDLVAPGDELTLAGRAGSTLWTDHPASRLAGRTYAVASGTSFAAPAVTGAAALVLEAAPSLSPTAVKAILELTATPLGDDPLAEGAGLVNAAGAVRLARYHAGLADRPEPRDEIAGETIEWGLAIWWDGYDTSGADLSSWTADLAVGGLDGTGILWDGLEVRYIGARVAGRGLLEPSQLAWADDSLWGTGILWDGELEYASSRVWSTPATWRSALVWPDRVSKVGVASPLYGDPAFSGLTEPVTGAADPTPPEPGFGE